MTSLRKKWISQPAFKWFKQVLPPLSVTEREAMESGSVWWDGALFSGSPDWQALHEYPKPSLSQEEQDFINNELQTLLGMLDDFDIVNHQRKLPDEVWQYIREHKFLSLIIGKQYGGRDFSALANSTIVSQIATKSMSAAVSVMVPNSLGPGELLTLYGTPEQKEYWLPRLADGTDVPCFALTGPEAGSDAGAIPDTGTVCYGEHQGEKVLGIKLSWNKRYITLAPIATVLGLAFKLKDPDHLIGEIEDIGITCALIPTSHPGVEVGDRHDPLGLAFMNGPTRGKDVFIPLDFLIGGVDYAGKGWRMLVECLSAGRGISLPALGVATAQLSARTTGAYAYVRRQFGLSIGKFEGVAEAMARIAGFTYMMEATRTLTTTALDLGEKPGIVTAMTKYHMTEMARQVLNDAMDIHAGRAIQTGPMNYLANHYAGVPVAITVEGANILTRNLMIFGQGATRCHPYVFAEMQAAAHPDHDKGAEAFDKLLFKHTAYSIKNALGSLGMALTGSRFAHAYPNSKTKAYYQDLTRLSKALALSSDFAMLTMGGDLKRKEMISARLGDVLSYLFIGSAILKRYQDDGALSEDLPLVDYGMQYCLSRAADALQQVYRNFPNRFAAFILRTLVFPVGNHFQTSLDASKIDLANLLMVPGAQRDRLTHLCYIGDENSNIGLIEAAFLAMYAIRDLEAKLVKGAKDGNIDRKAPLEIKLAQSLEANILTQNEVDKIKQAEKLRIRAIQVDHFSHDFSQVLTQVSQTKLRSIA